MNIQLENNRGKQWHKISNSYIKGFAFLEDKLLTIEDIYENLISAINNNELSKVLLSLNGNFSVVLRNNETTYLIVDKLKTLPLLYTKVKGVWLITDLAKNILNAESKLILNEDAIMTYLSVGYLHGNQTFFKNCNIVTAGTYVTLDEQATVIEYHNHIYDKRELSDDEIMEGCVLSLENSVKRMVASIGDRPIWIPLSGGYDSRLLACVCKKLGVKNVKCFTYGIPESNEVKISRKVAKQLDFPWFYVEYTKEKFLEIANSPMDDDYILWAMNLNTTSHYQDFIAFKELREKGVIEGNAIIVPGHSGEILGRDQVPYHLLDKNKTVADLLYHRYYQWNKPKRKIKKRLLKSLDNILHSTISRENKSLAIDLFTNWNIQNRQANFIVNSVRVYEYFGNDWRVPLWDDKLSEFWFSLKHEKNSAVQLYNKFMFEKYFITMGVPFYKEINRTTRLIARIRLPFNLKSKIKKELSKLPYFKKRYDPNEINYRAEFYLNKIGEIYSPYIEFKKNDTNSVIALYQIYLVSSFASKTNDSNLEKKVVDFI